MLRSALLAPVRWLSRRSFARPAIERFKKALGPERASRWARVVRHRLPETLRWHLDAVHEIPGEGIFLAGWVLDPMNELAAFDVVLGAGTVVSVMDRWIRAERPDVLKAFAQESRADVLVGFICLVPTGGAAGRPTLRLTARNGATESRVLLFAEPPSAVEFSKVVLGHFPIKHPGIAGIVRDHVGPALRALARRPHATPNPVVTSFGRRPEQPDATLLIPLYGRFDFIRYQMALFANDPGLAGVEIIYVVDDPRIVASSVDLALQSYEFFRVPVTVVAGERNLGFAGANNLGARAARGRHLVLLNSDVMPGRPGWLAKILAPLEDPTVGVVGAKLLYEDGTVQHAGMRVEPYELWGGLPILVHPGKGLPEQRASGAPREVDAVTGACMAVRRDDYAAMGGLDETYILGDFEDSDLCIRFRRRGQRTVLVTDVTLHHLERQSQWLMPDLEWRQKLSLVNCWQYSLQLAGGAR